MPNAILSQLSRLYRGPTVPINIPDQLPATEVLAGENIFVMGSSRASTQDIRPLKVVILNLMPKKIETEVQLLRLLSNSPLQVDVDLLRIDDRPSKNTPQEHLDTFYRSFEQVMDRNYDGMIITGAPLGLLPFHEVVYWDRIQRIMDWSTTHVNATLYLCWAAHAAIYHFWGIERHLRDEKLSGVYRHHIRYAHHPILRGFDNQFWVPHSRYAEVLPEDVAKVSELQIIADSPEAGIYLMGTEDGRQIFVTGHPEYTPETLHNEYMRDIEAGIEPKVPVNYYINDDPQQGFSVSWRSHGYLLFANWLNYCVYQQTPFDLNQITPLSRRRSSSGV